MGKVVKIEGSKEFGGDGFIRVRVIVDITQPLCRGIVVTLENGMKTWVSFKYERLPNLCYWCGCVGHDDKDCVVWLHSVGNLELSKKKHDSSIRVKPVYSSSKSAIHVPGYFESIKKRLVKHTPLSKGNPPVAVQKTAPKVPNSITFDKVSENLGPNITTNCSNPTRLVVSNPVIDSDSLDPNNGREDFLEKIEEIDKDMGRFELSETEVLEPKLTTLSKGGPNLDPSVPVIKPARWT